MKTKSISENQRRSLMALVGFVALGTMTQFRLRSQRQQGGSGKVVKLAFVTNNASDFWKIAAAGVHKYENEGRHPGRYQNAPQRHH